MVKKTSKNKKTSEELFWEKVRKTESCWLWIAYKSKRGYGRFQYCGTAKYAHQMPFIFSNIAIPEGHEIDHLCRNHSCVNPKHLEVISHQENVRRGHAGDNRKKDMAALTHCKNGHPFDQIIRAGLRPRGGYRYVRRCSICSRANFKSYYEKIKSTRQP